MNKIAIFNEFEKHLVKDTKPSIYFNTIIRKEEYNIYPYNMIFNMIKTNQSPKHHPEGNVWNHTMLVVDNAATNRFNSYEPKVFMWSALLHDIGKPDTTIFRKGRLTSYDHDKVGEKLVIKFLEELNCDNEFINKVSKMVRWHMQFLFVIKDLPFANIEKMLNEVNVNELMLLFLCDRLGRGNVSKKDIENEKGNIKIFINKCNSKLTLM